MATLPANTLTRSATVEIGFVDDLLDRSASEPLMPLPMPSWYGSESGTKSYGFSMSDSQRDKNLQGNKPDKRAVEPDLDTVRLIVSEINRGDSDAWPKLTQQINSYLTLMAEKNLPPAIQGQVNPSDIVQQTLLEVVQGINGFRGHTTAEFYGWLNQILRNQSRRITRDLTRQKRDVRRQVSINQDEKVDQPGIDPLDDMATPNSQAIARERLDLMEKSLRKLPEEYEQIIRWRNLEELSYEQIAEQLNRSVGAVSKLWYRAMVKLRTEIESLENETRQ